MLRCCICLYFGLPLPLVHLLTSPGMKNIFKYFPLVLSWECGLDQPNMSWECELYQTQNTFLCRLSSYICFKKRSSNSYSGIGFREILKSNLSWYSRMVWCVLVVVVTQADTGASLPLAGHWTLITRVPESLSGDQNIIHSYGHWSSCSNWRLAYQQLSMFIVCPIDICHLERGRNIDDDPSKRDISFRGSERGQGRVTSLYS